MLKQFLWIHHHCVFTNGFPLVSLNLCSIQVPAKNFQSMKMKAVFLLINQPESIKADARVLELTMLFNCQNSPLIAG